MGKRHYFLIIDTETTMENTVADFGAVICDRKGNVYAECGVLVAGHYGTFELFHDIASNDIWGFDGLNKRKDNYKRMLESGHRMLASVNAINKWLVRAAAKFNPELTAYNIAFDLDKLNNTDIDVSMFARRFCLWQAAAGNFGHTKKYRQFIIDNHLFNAPTKFGNMTYKTNAEVMCGYLTGNYVTEPHTALEDAKFFELPILVEILKQREWRGKSKPYNWKEYQTKNWYMPATASNKKGSLI